MNSFTYNTFTMYTLHLGYIKAIGVDFEAQMEELTIVTDELTIDELSIMNYHATN